MSLSRPLQAGAAALAAVLVVAAGITAATSRSYTAEFVMPSAAGTFAGDDIKIGGQPAGTVDRIDARGNKALVTVSLDGDFAPLHDGTTARISWEAVLNERFLEVLPGPASRPALPSGSRIVSNIERVELGDVLSMLDRGR